MNLEGPEVDSAPGLNPSILLHVGMVPRFQQAVKPRLAPANPTKVFTLLDSEGPTLQVPCFSSVADPPLMIFLPMVTPMECPMTLTVGAPVYSRTASRKALIWRIYCLAWLFWLARFELAGPQVVVQSSPLLYPWLPKQVNSSLAPVCHETQPSVVPLPKAKSLFPWTKITGVFTILSSALAFPPKAAHFKSGLSKFQLEYPKLKALLPFCLRKFEKSYVNPQVMSRELTCQVQGVVEVRQQREEAAIKAVRSVARRTF